MKLFYYPICVGILALIFFLWSPFSRGEAVDVYADTEGHLLIPEHNVSIVSVELADANISFTSAEQLLRLRPLEQDFIELNGVSKVDSILSISRVISTEFDIIVEKAIPSDDETLSDDYLENLAAELGLFPELSPYIDEELDTLLFYIYFSNKTAAQDIHSSLIKLQEVWESEIPFNFTGRSPVIAETETLLSKDIILFFPLLGLMLILVFMLFRSFKVLLLSLLLISISIVAAYAFVQFLGIKNSPLILLIPVFSLGLLSDYLIHYFYHRIYSALGEHRTVRSILLFPLSLTALSTLIGFLSLSLISGSGHIQLGIIIAAAVLLSWAGVFFWLDYGKYRQSPNSLMVNFQNLQGKFFAKIVNFRYLFFLIIAAGMTWGLFQMNNLRIEPYPIEQLPAKNTIKEADNVINTDFHGTVTYFIELDSGEANGILTKEAMLKLDGIHRLLGESEVGFSYSLLKVLLRLNYYLLGDEESFLTVEESPEEYRARIEQYLIYFSSSIDPLEYEALVDNSYRFVSLRGLIYYRNYDDLDRFLSLVEQMRGDLPQGWSLSLYGAASQLEKEHNNLRNNWVISFLSGSLLIFITVWLFYRKLSLALLSLIPGIISMIITFGFIALAGIRIDVFSIIFVAIITGLVIDYSIHTLVALDHLGKVGTLEKGFTSIVGYSGIPIFLSFLTSLLSFSILFISSFSGARNLGLLLLVSLILSFFLSLYLIPLIVLPLRLKKEKNNE